MRGGVVLEMSGSPIGVLVAGVVELEAQCVVVVLARAQHFDRVQVAEQGPPQMAVLRLACGFVVVAEHRQGRP